MIELDASPRLKASLGMLVALQDKPMYQGDGKKRNKWQNFWKLRLPPGHPAPPANYGANSPRFCTKSTAS